MKGGSKRHSSLGQTGDQSVGARSFWSPRFMGGDPLSYAICQQQG